jgi:uncharacterized protein
MVVEALTPADTAELGKSGPADALDTFLVCGGYPHLTEEWDARQDFWTNLERQLTPYSALVVTGERILSSEFPEGDAARALQAIGSGERNFTNIGAATGLAQVTLTRTLGLLSTKRVLEVMHPLSTETHPRQTRYAIADPYLRFWLRFVRLGIPEIQRGRPDLVLENIRTQWSTYRGGAIEPVVRDAVTRLLPAERFGAARYVGSYWTRSNEWQVDLVGSDKPEAATTIPFVGSIKWRDNTPFDEQDARALAVATARVPGTDTGTRLVGVSRSGYDAGSLDVALTPADVVQAFAQGGSSQLAVEN